MDARAKREADSPQIEVSPEMIAAGVHAFYANKSADWNSPRSDELEEMMRTIFLAMWFRRCSQ